jgi:hypothetical protein
MPVAAVGRYYLLTAVHTHADESAVALLIPSRVPRERQKLLRTTRRIHSLSRADGGMALETPFLNVATVFVVVTASETRA